MTIELSSHQPPKPHANKAKETTSHCPVCHSNSSVKILFSKDGYDFARCTACKVIRLSPMPTDEILRRHYSQRAAQGNYNPSIAEFRSQSLKSILDIALTAFKHPSLGQNYLDIGCFDGKLLDFAKTSGFTTWGIELQPEAAAKAAQNHADRIYQGRLEDFKADRKFSIMSAIGLIEHLQNPISLLELARTHLAENGVLLIQTPNHGSWLARLMSKYWFCYAAPEHTFYFSRSSLANIAKSYGLTEVLYKPHFKKLSISYVYDQMSYWGKEVRFIFGLIYNLIPKPYRQANLYFYGGEMIQVFKRDQSL